MIRDVDLVSYLPPFMQTYKEPVAALEAENAEFAIMWNAVDWVLKNRFITTADEYGISRFEKILGILPGEEDTLESRRLRVQSKWFNKIPYTIEVLLKKLKILCEDRDFSLEYDFQKGYDLKIITNFTSAAQLEELKNLVDTMLPCNINVINYNLLSANSAGEVYTVGGITHTILAEITN